MKATCLTGKGVTMSQGDMKATCLTGKGVTMSQGDMKATCLTGKGVTMSQGDSFSAGLYESDLPDWEGGHHVTGRQLLGR